MAWTLPAARRRPADLGQLDGRLAPCPQTPNCVSSQSGDPAHAVDPFAYTGDRAEGQRRLLALLDADPRATLVTVDDGYVHAEFQAMMFVDDVEFYLPDDGAVVHVRSASRVGRSDLGANRRRVEDLRERFTRQA